MEAVHVVSTTTIHAPSHCNDGDSSKQIELTPWDLIFLPIETNQRGLLFRNEENHTASQILHLKHTLSSTLAFFPPLTGRLATLQHPDNTVSYHIVCNNAGALFVHAIAHNTTVSDILQPNYVPLFLNSFFPLNGIRNYQGTSQPLLGVQVTELLDGVFIAFSINHAVADGQSFWHFVNSWAEISRGSQKISKLPVFERYFPEDINRPIRFPFTEEEKQHSKSLIPELPAERIFRFSEEKIAQLKLKANTEVNTNKISSLQALLTHLWRSVIRCQSLDPKEETHCMMMMGARPRMDPPLGEGYFGNAGVVSGVSMKAGELLQSGLGKVALEMNKIISLHSHERMKNQYESWVRSPKLARLGGMACSTALATSSSPRFDIYGNDFGWGKPVAVRSGGANKSNGKLSVFCGAEEGSIDIEVCLPYEILEAMEKDTEFMGAISP
ncbi:hypothetical protein RJT34_30741 [Clitoria ternatea]|uniref:Acetyltransferase n=1 Tax=Clitoria ternatea TaxID=43366 RepID=A0AAN9I7N8_CLITE